MKKKVEKVTAPAPSGGLIEADKLCSLSGLSDRRHRQLADQGYFPPPIKSQYQTTPTLIGLFRFYKEYSQRHHATREGIQAEILRTKKRENDEAAGLLVLKADVAEELQKFLTPALSFIRQKFENELPMSMSGMGVAENRILGERFYDDLSKRFRDELLKWKV